MHMYDFGLPIAATLLAFMMFVAVLAPFANMARRSHF